MPCSSLCYIQVYLPPIVQSRYSHFHKKSCIPPSVSMVPVWGANSDSIYNYTPKNMIQLLKEVEDPTYQVKYMAIKSPTELSLNPTVCVL